MKQRLSNFICLVFLAAILVTAVVYNMSKPRVMVLHSYDPAYAWTRDVDKGLRRVMDQWSGCTVTWHYMSTKKLSDPQWLERAGILARRAIKETNPRVLIAVDDLAQSRAARHFVDHPTMDIVFAGVNGGVGSYGYTGAANVTGIFERKQLTAVKEAILALESKKAVPNPTPSVTYVVDPSPSLARGLPHIRAFDWAPVKFKAAVIAKDYPDWKETIMAHGSRSDYLLVANYRKLHMDGPDSPYADPAQVMAWTDRASAAPVIGINSFNVEDGAMISIGVSPFEQGEEAARMAETILKKNVRAGTLPMKKNRQYVVAIREDSLRQKHMALPAIYEAFGRATENFIEAESPQE